MVRRGVFPAQAVDAFLGAAVSPETDHLAALTWPTIDGARTYGEPSPWQVDEDLAVAMSLAESRPS